MANPLRSGRGRTANRTKKARAEEFWKQRPGKRATRTKWLRKRPRPTTKVSLDGEKVRDGLAQLVLTVVELLRELLEKQAIRRMEHGTLSDEQIERLGATFMSLRAEIERLKTHFNLKDEDLNLDLGPLGYLRGVGEDSNLEKASLVDILDRLLGKGVFVKGDVIVSVADVDLIALRLGLVLASIDQANELMVGSPRVAQLEEEMAKFQRELGRT